MAYKDIKPYSDLVHQASINGGVEKYIADIEKYNFLKGKSVGRLEGIVVSALVGGAILGKNIWDKHKLKVEEEKELEKRAENMNKENE